MKQESYNIYVGYDHLRKMGLPDKHNVFVMTTTESVSSDKDKLTRWWTKYEYHSQWEEWWTSERRQLGMKLPQNASFINPQNPSIGGFIKIMKTLINPLLSNNSSVIDYKQGLSIDKLIGTNDFNKLIRIRDKVI